MSLQRDAGLKLFFVLLAGLAFLCVPALLAAAGVEAVPTSARAEQAIAARTQDLEAELAAEGLSLGQPVFLRVTKQPAELTAYVEAEDGTYRAFRTWPVCAVSGTLGPKLAEGDGQAPEGFYEIRPAQMNPASDYHLSFNLGYPNAYDRAQGRTGSFLMVHGACVSIGCFAMTDAGIEEIWTLMNAAFQGGQRRIPVHIYPFEMTDANLQRHSGTENSAFWRMLAPAWVAFEETGKVPQVQVENGAYAVTPVFQ